MTFSELAEQIRAEVAGRRELDRRIRLIQQSRGRKLVRIRCPEPDCGRAIATIQDTSQGAYYYAIIEELPWDHREPPAWHSFNPAHFPIEDYDGTDRDEELVSIYTELVYVDRPRPPGMPNYGEVTTLTDRGGWIIRDLLDDSPWHPELWARCRNHPKPVRLDRMILRVEAGHARRRKRTRSYIASQM